MNFVEWVYDTLNAQLAEGYELPGVETVFTEGGCCTEAYEQMREAYARLCERLGVVDEDKDVEIIIQSFECIQKEMCEKMYYYGAKFGNENPS